MKKTSTIIESKEVYNIEQLLGNIALITSNDGKSGLLDIKTNNIVGSFDNYENKYNSNTKFYYQEKEITLDTLVEIKEKELRIYDVLENKCIADNWLVIYKKRDEFELVVLQDNNGKYHIFEEKNYRTYKNAFYEEFDFVKVLGGAWRIDILVKKNGKFGIYTTNNDMLIETTKIIYDDIEERNGIFIYTLNGKKTFNVDDNTIWFDDIIFDKNKSIIYGITSNGISVYQLPKCNLLFTTNKYDKLKFLIDCDKNERTTTKFLFVTEKDNKFGIASYGNKNLLTSTKVFKSILDPVYDNITWSNGTIFFNKNGKTGIMKIIDTQIKFIEAKYDKIVYLYNNFYTLYEDELCNIINIKSSDNILVKKCEFIKHEKETIIYKKDGKYGIISTHDKYWNSYGYDSITHLFDDYFMIEKNGKYGIYNNYCKIIIEPIYNSIDMHIAKGRLLSKDIYFIVKDQKYQLLRCPNLLIINELSYFNHQEYEEIIIMPDIIIFKDNNLIQVYDYRNILVGKFNKDTIIEPIVENNQTFYLVNDSYYFYKNGVFEKVNMANTQTYTTMYECEYGTIIVSDYDKKIHDKSCQSIEAIEEEEINKTLFNYYNKSKELQKKYPTLKK